MGGKGSGNTRNIETPDKMLELFNDYREWAKANPIQKMDFVGKDGRQVFYELKRPLTFDGFEVYVIDRGIIKSSLQHYSLNTNGAYKEFADVMDYIRKVIRDDQISGGMAGIYNPNITQRLNGLAEKVENKHEVSEIKITKE